MIRTSYINPAAGLVSWVARGPPRGCRQCSARDDHGSARHETQCSTGCVTQPLYPWSKEGLKLSGSRHHDYRQRQTDHQYEHLLIRNTRGTCTINNASTLLQGRSTCPLSRGSSVYYPNVRCMPPAGRCLSPRGVVFPHGALCLPLVGILENMERMRGRQSRTIYM